MEEVKILPSSTQPSAPHSPQNFMPSGFSAWHFGHFIFLSYNKSVGMSILG
jgi:hypothetical protein